MAATNSLGLVLSVMRIRLCVLLATIALSVCSCDAEGAGVSEGDGVSQAGSGAGGPAGQGGAGARAATTVSSAGDERGDVRVAPSSDDAGQNSVVGEGGAGGEGGEAGEAGEAEPPAADAGPEQPVATTTELCSARVPYANAGTLTAYTWQGNSGIASDAQGDLYVLAIVHDTIEIAGQTITPQGGHDTVLLKYGADCQLEWLKQFGGPNADVGMLAIAAGPDGELAMAGVLNGTVDLGAGAQGLGLYPSALLVKLSAADGGVLWNKGYGALFSGAGIYDVAIDDAGDIAFSGIAHQETSFGAGAIGGTRAEVSYVAKVSRAGELRYAFAVDDNDSIQPIALHGSGELITAGRTSMSRFAIGEAPFALDQPDASRYIARLDAAGEPLSVHTVFTADSFEMDGWWGGAFVVDSDRSVIFERQMRRDDGTGTLTYYGLLGKLAADGALAWSLELAPAGAYREYYSAGIAADSAGNSLHAFQLEEPARIAPPGRHVHVEKRSPAGDLAWRNALGEGDAQTALGVATAPDGSAWVLHSEDFPEQTTTPGAFVITKLAP